MRAALMGRAATEAEAEAALVTFGEAWNKRYPSISRRWTAQWSLVTPFLRFGPDIRRAIYTTNAIEALNSQLRRALKPRGHFPNDEAVLKVLYLALERASRNWSMPIADWQLALQQLAVHFDGRIPL
jgi:putative transposase